MSEFKVLGQTIEEFMIRWNKVTFQLGGLNESFAEKLARIYINELKTSLTTYNVSLEMFFINLSRGGSISMLPVKKATSAIKIKEFYRYNLWGTSIPYTLPIVLDMSPPLKGKAVLDVGCGFGRLSIFCALKQAARVVAVDLSKPLIQSLEQTGKSLKLFNLETYVMDAEELKFQSEQFDIIYCCEVIEHLITPLRTLRLMQSLLKPGGSLILSTPNGLNVVGFKQRFLKLFHYNWVSPYGTGQPELHMFTPMNIKMLLAASNFKIKCLRGAELLDNLSIFYPSNIAEGLVQFLPLLFPIFQKIKNCMVRLGKTPLFKNFGLEMFIHAIPINKP